MNISTLPIVSGQASTAMPKAMASTPWANDQPDGWPALRWEKPWKIDITPSTNRYAAKSTTNTSRVAFGQANIAMPSSIRMMPRTSSTHQYFAAMVPMPRTVVMTPSPREESQMRSACRCRQQLSRCAHGISRQMPTLDARCRVGDESCLSSGGITYDASFSAAAAVRRGGPWPSDQDNRPPGDRPDRPEPGCCRRCCRAGARRRRSPRLPPATTVDQPRSASCRSATGRIVGVGQGLQLRVLLNRWSARARSDAPMLTAQSQD